MEVQPYESAFSNQIRHERERCNYWSSEIKLLRASKQSTTLAETQLKWHRKRLWNLLADEAAAGVKKP